MVKTPSGGSFTRAGLPDNGALPGAKQLHGKGLNINDAEAALSMVREFNMPPLWGKTYESMWCCMWQGYARAYIKAYNADPVSILGLSH